MWRDRPSIAVRDPLNAAPAFMENNDGFMRPYRLPSNRPGYPSGGLRITNVGANLKPFVSPVGLTIRSPYVLFLTPN